MSNDIIDLEEAQLAKLEKRALQLIEHKLHSSQKEVEQQKSLLLNYHKEHLYFSYQMKEVLQPSSESQQLVQQRHSNALQLINQTIEEIHQYVKHFLAMEHKFRQLVKEKDQEISELKTTKTEFIHEIAHCHRLFQDYAQLSQLFRQMLFEQTNSVTGAIEKLHAQMRLLTKSTNEQYLLISRGFETLTLYLRNISEEKTAITRTLKQKIEVINTLQKEVRSLMHSLDYEKKSAQEEKNGMNDASVADKKKKNELTTWRWLQLAWNFRNVENEQEFLDKIEQLSASIAHLQQEVKGIEHVVEKLERELVDYSAQHSAYEQQLEDMRKKIKQMEEQEEEFTAHVEELKKKNEQQTKQLQTAIQNIQHKRSVTQDQPYQSKQQTASAQQYSQQYPKLRRKNSNSRSNLQNSQHHSRYNYDLLKQYYPNAQYQRSIFNPFKHS